MVFPEERKSSSKTGLHLVGCRELLANFKKGFYLSFHLGFKNLEVYSQPGHFVICNQCAGRVSGHSWDKLIASQQVIQWAGLCVIAPANPRLTIWASVCYKARRKGGKQVDLNMDKLEDHPPTLSLWWGKEREIPAEVENVWNWRCWTEVWKEWDLGERMVTSAWEMLRWGVKHPSGSGSYSSGHRVHLPLVDLLFLILQAFWFKLQNEQQAVLLFLHTSLFPN